MGKKTPKGPSLIEIIAKDGYQSHNVDQNGRIVISFGLLNDSDSLVAEDDSDSLVTRTLYQKNGSLIASGKLDLDSFLLLYGLLLTEVETLQSHAQATGTSFKRTLGRSVPMLERSLYEDMARKVGAHPEEVKTSGGYVLQVTFSPNGH